MSKKKDKKTTDLTQSDSLKELENYQDQLKNRPKAVEHEMLDRSKVSQEHILALNTLLEKHSYLKPIVEILIGKDNIK